MKRTISGQIQILPQQPGPLNLAALSSGSLLHIRWKQSSPHQQVILWASFDAMDASSLILGTSRKSGIQGSFCISSSYSGNGTRTSSTSMASRRTSEGLGVRSSNLCRKRNSAAVAPKCSSDGTEQWWGVEKKEVTAGQKGKAKESLKAGSAVVVTEAPPMLKTAEPMPMMRANNGVINVGDAGRVIDRKPKDVWAVRFAVGAYLIDRKYFEPLEL